MFDPSLFDQPYFFLLESTQPGAAGGWSVAAWNPKEVITSRKVPDILAVIQRSLRKERKGIWIGYLGYEYYAHFIDKVAARRSDLIPEAVFCYYENYVAGTAGPVTSGAFKQGSPRTTPCSSNFTRPAYLSAVHRIKNYITAGDCYQVNLSQRFTSETDEPPFTLYQRLREISPAPYAAFLNLGDAQILCASPECFLQVEGREVFTWPIKGTRPRGKTPEEDARLKEELTTSKKDRAELLMITDLLRNDLGRVCEQGSITVPRLAEVKSFAQVHHLVSTIKGRLKPDTDSVDLLHATFPGGSITGAPKIRAMQIIHELEDLPRNVYTGAIGFIRADGSAIFNIAIRTMVYKPLSLSPRGRGEGEGGRVYFWGGGGIVADSDPEAEYEETVVKTEGLRKTLIA